MKNIILIAAVMMFGTVGFGQVKVVGPSGDVKIGNTSEAPTEKLDVDGILKVRGNLIRLGQNGGTDPVNMLIGADRTADGNAIFSLISDASAYPVWGTRMFRNNVGAAGFQHRGNRVLQFSTLENANISFFTNSISRMVIRNNGQVEIAGSATVNGGLAVTSDRRLKTNVSPFEKGLKELLNLEPVRYQYNGKGGTTKGREFVGLIAQELQEIVPEFVSGHTFNDVDIEGNLKSSEDFLKIHDSEIKYLIVNAVQEQQEIINNQNKLISKQAETIKEVQNELDEIKALIQSISNAGIDSNNQIDITLESEKSAKLSQNYPNPFDGNTKIDYVLPANAINAQIVFYSVDGKVLKSVPVSDEVGTININSQELGKGVYTYQLLINGQIQDTLKMVRF